jgi:hypothetical protein
MLRTLITYLYAVSSTFSVKLVVKKVDFATIPSGADYSDGSDQFVPFKLNYISHNGNEPILSLKALENLARNTLSDDPYIAQVVSEERARIEKQKQGRPHPWHGRPHQSSSLVQSRESSGATSSRGEDDIYNPIAVPSIPFNDISNDLKSSANAGFDRKNMPILDVHIFPVPSTGDLFKTDR